MYHTRTIRCIRYHLKHAQHVVFETWNIVCSSNVWKFFWHCNNTLHMTFACVNRTQVVYNWCLKRKYELKYNENNDIISKWHDHQGHPSSDDHKRSGNNQTWDTIIWVEVYSTRDLGCDLVYISWFSGTCTLYNQPDFQVYLIVLILRFVNDRI